jgi:hypothetical protein
VQSMKSCFKESNTIRTHFLRPAHRKKRLGRSRLSNFLSRRMALRTLNLSCRCLKKRIWWSRWSDVSRCQKDMQNNFLHPVNLKKRLGRSCLSDVLSRRMALRTHNLSSGSFKKLLWWSHEAMFQGVKRPCKIIFCIQGIEKTDLDEVV